jgi:hypothetical protein
MCTLQLEPTIELRPLDKGKCFIEITYIITRNTTKYLARVDLAYIFPNNKMNTKREMQPLTSNPPIT